MNPCPCGYAFDARKACHCPPAAASAYRRRVSGPIYDRIDLCVVLGAPSLGKGAKPEAASAVRARIERVHALGRHKPGGEPLDLTHGPHHLAPECQEWLDRLCEKAYLSFRSLHKTVRVARTIADLAEKETIELDHLREAWELRCRDFWK